MESQRTITHGSDWHDINAVEYSIDEITREAIKSARRVLQENPVVKQIIVDGYNIFKTVKAFKDIDDVDEISKDDCFYLRTDVHQIIVSKGDAWFRADGKYDNESYYEFELNI